MKNKILLLLLTFSILPLCSCDDEVSYSFDRKMIERQSVKFPPLPFECSEFQTYWDIDFEGKRTKLFQDEINTFTQGYKLVFEKRWINGLVQWMPTKFELDNSSESMIEFSKLPVYPSCNFYVENSQTQYVSYDIEFEVLVVKDERTTNGFFPPAFKFIDYNRDVNQLDKFSITHKNIYDMSGIDEEDYISLRSKLSFKNTNKGLQFVEVVGLKESAKEIVGFKDFYDIKVIEYLDTALFIKTEVTDRASFMRAGICIPLHKLDSMLKVTQTRE